VEGMDWEERWRQTDRDGQSCGNKLKTA
jgi:hypothetical protein